jgi:transposase InsO family protein
MPELLTPKDHAEAIAVFRAQVIGPLLCRDERLHGDLAAAIRELAQTPVKPPGSETHRTYSVPTLQRWYYAFRRNGLAGLTPRARSDRGYAHALSPEERALLLPIRRENPGVAATVILNTLLADGRLERGCISAATLRRLYAQEGLDRRTLKQVDSEVRRRWQASAPQQLWHADVCHGPALRIDGRSVPLRIHAILDDYSRHIVALQASTHERESEMLALMLKALRSHSAPEVLYLDNGATYSGAALQTACSRLGIGLVHARPYDPQARGKMERFWRTMREQCLDHCAGLASVHDVQVRLLAWLSKQYLVTPHAGLLGGTPQDAFGQQTAPVDEGLLREALIVRARRRLRRDCTLSIAGTDFELDQGYLAGRNVTVARSLAQPSELPWVEHEDQRLPLRLVAPIANGKRIKKRSPQPKRGIDAIPFDPATAILERFVGTSSSSIERGAS